MRQIVIAIDWVLKKLGLGIALTCASHPTYHGTARKPKSDCAGCALLYTALYR